VSGAREWDAASYHQVSTPQTTWGEKVLARLALDGDERVLDAGCGSGRLTASLAARLPGGHVVALDRSWNMLQVAQTNLRPAFGRRLSFVQASLPDLPFQQRLDVVFSTATFHWVPDHAALFAGVARTLRHGGRLHAQCGGGPNLHDAHALAEIVMARVEFAPWFAGWPGVWQFATVDETVARLGAAGFVDLDVWLEPAPTTLATEDDYRAFVTTVIYHPHLARLPDRLRGAFLDAVTALAAETSPPFSLDYWRLNLAARTG
jgi:trans-aconitate 2-methyltransferase